MVFLLRKQARAIGYMGLGLVAATELGGRRVTLKHHRKTSRHSPADGLLRAVYFCRPLEGESVDGPSKAPVGRGFIP